MIKFDFLVQIKSWWSNKFRIFVYILFFTEVLINDHVFGFDRYISYMTFEILMRQSIVLGNPAVWKFIVR